MHDKQHALRYPGLRKLTKNAQITMLPKLLNFSREKPSGLAGVRALLLAYTRLRSESTRL
jgi:hypothetical protein